MFCVTFYSFKGGVGRTLALANVAAVLAAGGKKVLVVDFDLEAPGLSTLPPFNEGDCGKGILDFVLAYRDTGIVPALDGYIGTHEFEERVFDENTGELNTFYHSMDLMPAGGGDGYSANFAGLDWNELYEKRDGFLLMETLRERWKDAGYDYVLIDSRTGHTDVGGICTRQLPDAVVCLFFLNEQNLMGLSEVVHGIKEAGARPQPIELIFAASRVPRLDDEYGDVRRWLQKFKSELGYKDDQFVMIEHYDSLRLLDQELFAITRPKSGLGTQYRQLVEAISERNEEDAEGAFRFGLNIANSRAEAIGSPGDQSAVLERLASISEKHVDDVRVQFALARAFYRLRSLSMSAQAAELALAAGANTRTKRPITKTLPSNIHRMRLRALLELDRADEAMTSAFAILDDPCATITTVIDAILAVSADAGSELREAADYAAIAAASTGNLLRIVRELTDLPNARKISGEISEIILERPDAEELLKKADLELLQLQLIAAGRFKRAAQMRLPIEDRYDGVQAKFNAAMASWGAHGSVDREVFGEIAEALSDMNVIKESANGLECLALCYAVNGLVAECDEAADRSDRVLGSKLQREFSCWSYQKESVAVFRDHLEAIRAMARGEHILPLVFQPHR